VAYVQVTTVIRVFEGLRSRSSLRHWCFRLQVD